MRRIGFRFGLALLFVRISYIHQIISFETGVNTRLLYIVGIPTLLAMFAGGTMGRTFLSIAGKAWLGFIAWMALACVFSIWSGGSASLFSDYVRTSVPILLIGGGFAMTWRDCESVVYTMAGAGMVNVLSSRLFIHDAEGRLSLDFGTMSNSNDLAAHLLFVMPFMLYVVLKPKAKTIFKIPAAIAVAWCLYMIVGTASRGALLALVGVGLLTLIKGTGAQRLMLLAAAAVSIPLLLAVMPTATLQRLTSFSSSSKASTEEALASSSARAYLLQRSLAFTAYNPLFGVGPGQFSNAVGNAGKAQGMKIWQETHNFFTQISSECGIPALIFYLTAVVSAIFRANRTLARASRSPEFSEVRLLCFCLLLSMTGYGIASVFLNLAYMFYWLALSGVAISTSVAAEAEFFNRTRSLVEPARPGYGRVAF